LQEHILIDATGALVSDDAALARTKDQWLRDPSSAKLWWGSLEMLQANPPTIADDQEISFIPHPKTMTMAGEWEYFAAGSQHPFPYAVAELIDNSLRATRGNVQQRRIVVSLVSGSSASAGLVSVWDNGCGMTLQQLNEWAGASQGRTSITNLRHQSEQQHLTSRDSIGDVTAFRHECIVEIPACPIFDALPRCVPYLCS
jgi:hypothetical protein